MDEFLSHGDDILNITAIKFLVLNLHIFSLLKLDSTEVGILISYVNKILAYIKNLRRINLMVLTPMHLHPRDLFYHLT